MSLTAAQHRRLATRLSETDPTADSEENLHALQRAREHGLVARMMDARLNRNVERAAQREAALQQLRNSRRWTLPWIADNLVLAMASAAALAVGLLALRMVAALAGW